MNMFESTLLSSADLWRTIFSLCIRYWGKAEGRYGRSLETSIQPKNKWSALNVKIRGWKYGDVKCEMSNIENAFELFLCARKYCCANAWLNIRNNQINKWSATNTIKTPRTSASARLKLEESGWFYLCCVGNHHNNPLKMDKRQERNKNYFFLLFVHIGHGCSEWGRGAVQ